MSKTIAAIFVTGAAVLLASCMTPRGETALAIPPATQANYPVTKSTVILVHVVTDERVFEQGAADLSTLSMVREDAGGAPPDVKARTYAREREDVGKPIQNVLVEDGRTVASVVRDNVLAGFRQAGYRATTDPAEAGPSPMQVDVHIMHFWAWYARRNFLDTLDADIETRLDTTVAPTPIVVSAHAEYTVEKNYPGLHQDRGSWVVVLNQALANYRAQLGAKFAYLP